MKVVKEEAAEVNEGGVEEVGVSCRWEAAEVREYLNELQHEYRLPIYAYRPFEDPSPMSALVPPQMGVAFAACRAHPLKFPPLPHTSLIRDWVPMRDVEEEEWWSEFWSRDEVLTAQDARKAGGIGTAIDELKEHRGRRCSWARGR